MAPRRAPVDVWARHPRIMTNCRTLRRKSMINAKPHVWTSSLFPVRPMAKQYKRKRETERIVAPGESIYLTNNDLGHFAHKWKSKYTHATDIIMFTGKANSDINPVPIIQFNKNKYFCQQIIYVFAIIIKNSILAY